MANEQFPSLFRPLVAWVKDYVDEQFKNRGIGQRFIDGGRVRGTVDANVRVGIRKNSGNTTYQRRRLNLIEGSGVTITTTDDAADEEVDVTISSTAIGGATSGNQFIDPTRAVGDLIYRNPVSISSLVIGFIGDSITARDGIGGSTNPPEETVTGLTTATVTVTSNNQGHDGAKTSNWVPNSTYLDNAKSAFGTSVRIVHVMLGSNDAGADVAAAVYGANLRSTAENLVSAGYIVVLSYPPYRSEDAGALAYLQAYQTEIDNICNGVTIFQGDTEAYGYFEAHTTELSDGLHLTATGVTSLSGLWADVLSPFVDAISGLITLQALTIGSTGKVLTPINGLPAWSDVVQLQGRSVASTAPTDGQGLIWDAANSRWKPGMLTTESAFIGGEPLVEDGVSAPPTTLTNEAEDDWLCTDL